MVNIPKNGAFDRYKSLQERKDQEEAANVQSGKLGAKVEDLLLEQAGDMADLFELEVEQDKKFVNTSTMEDALKGEKPADSHNLVDRNVPQGSKGTDTFDETTNSAKKKPRN